MKYKLFSLIIAFTLAFSLMISAEDNNFVSEKENWNVSVSSVVSWSKAENMIDQNSETLWHSDYRAENDVVVEKAMPPHIFEITLPEVTAVSGFRITPRATNAGGWITEYEAYVAYSDTDEYVKIHKGNFPATKDNKSVKFFKNLEIKRFKLVALVTRGDTCVIAEFDLYGKDESKETIKDYEAYAIYAEGAVLQKVDTSAFKATSTSDWSDKVPAANVVDGKFTPAWHSHPDDKDKYPYTLTIDMGMEYQLSEFIYYPRTDDKTAKNGVWTDFDIYTSSSGKADDYVKVMGNLGFEVSYDAQTITFEKPLKAHFLKFVINEGSGGYATCAELEFFETLAAKKEREESNKWILTVGSDEMKIIKGGKEEIKKMDVAPFIQNGTTLIPLRGFFEELGAEISWDGNFRKVTINYNNIKIEFTVMDYSVYVKEAGKTVRYSFTVPSQIHNSRTFIPLRFISEQLGYKVEWNGETQEITITK